MALRVRTEGIVNRPRPNPCWFDVALDSKTGRNDRTRDWAEAAVREIDSSEFVILRDFLGLLDQWDQKREDK